MCLTRRVSIGASVQCKCEGFVISEYMKMSAFKEVVEMFDCEIHFFSSGVALAMRTSSM